MFKCHLYKTNQCRILSVGIDQHALLRYRSLHFCTISLVALNNVFPIIINQILPMTIGMQIQKRNTPFARKHAKNLCSRQKDWYQVYSLQIPSPESHL